jgi:hypothetical protein
VSSALGIMSKSGTSMKISIGFDRTAPLLSSYGCSYIQIRYSGRIALDYAHMRGRKRRRLMRVIPVMSLD